MASVVGKTIFSDGKGKLFFGYYKTDDAVEFVDYKTWKKLNFKDVSKGDTNKERVIKAILKNQKQFNKKVDYNMWSKKGKPSFEDKMDWFIKNGWINNINKGGIREGAADVNKVQIPGDIKIKLQKALDVLNGKKLNYQQKLQVLGRVLDSMGIDKTELSRVSQKLKTKLESVNESVKPSQVRSAISKVKKQLMRKWKQKGGYENFGQKELSQMKDKFDYNPYGSSDERQISKMLDGFDNWAMNYDGNMREGKKRYYQTNNVGSSKYLISYHDGKKTHKDGSDFFDIQTFKNKKDLAKFVNALHKSGYVYGFDEAVNEGILQDREKQLKNLKQGGSASGGGYGTFKKTGRDTFVSPKGKKYNSSALIKLIGTFGDFKVNESVNEVRLKKGDKVRFKNGEYIYILGPKGDGYDYSVGREKGHHPKGWFDMMIKSKKATVESVTEDKGEVEKIAKQVGKNEIKFYDALSKVEKRLGSKYPQFLDTALKQLKQNPAKFKTNADKEEAIFQSVK